MHNSQVLNQNSIFHQLPIELFEMIIFNLNHQTCCQMMIVCQHFHATAIESAKKSTVLSIETIKGLGSKLSEQCENKIFFVSLSSELQNFSSFFLICKYFAVYRKEIIINLEQTEKATTKNLISNSTVKNNQLADDILILFQMNREISNIKCYGKLEYFISCFEQLENNGQLEKALNLCRLISHELHDKNHSHGFIHLHLYKLLFDLYNKYEEKSQFDVAIEILSIMFEINKNMNIGCQDLPNIIQKWNQKETFRERLQAFYF